MEDKGKKRTYFLIADLSTMGIAMVLSIVLGLVVGLYLDKHLGTDPVFTLVCILLGILAGFRIMYRTYMRFFNDTRSTSDVKKPRKSCR